ncbi:MAG: hypothetical protein KF729_34580 [Sandaracinaceae bacterium]|nr:hypothetical protein [Sandaracinaceae bacterium]
MRASRPWLLFGASLGLFAACDGATECVDLDRDGYGPGCALGDDCDPNNADRNVDCVSTPPPDCAATPNATGCPCLAGALNVCLDERAGVGACLAGTTVCTNGFWGACRGGVAPRAEQCNGLDDDCDGLVDDGVQSPCGGCTPGCLGGVWGDGAAPFEEGGGLALTRFGELTLAMIEQTFGVVWVANSAEGTVSRIDADRALETARYPSGGAEPSRVAVDHLGDAWVLNREFDGVPSAARIFGEPERCVDRDGDGVVETSSGASDVRPLAEEECVALRVELGDAGGVARAIAIDGDTGLDGISGGDPWIGLHDAEAIVELDGFSGALLRRVETPGFQPYDATFDPWGILWMISRDGILARIDPRPVEPTVELIEVPLPCYLLYGLAADCEGRLLLTGFSCDRVASYDPAIGLWQTRATPASPRAATFDGASGFWIAHTGAEVSAVALDPLRVIDTRSLIDAMVVPIESIGVAVDASGQVWAVSSQGGAGGTGVATRLDPVSGEVSAQVPVGRAPHVQGDLAGNRVRHAHVERGSATHVFEGCGAEVPTAWARVHVAADPGAYGRVTVEARQAPDRAALAAAAFVELGVIPARPAPWALEVPEGGVLEVRLTLEVDGRVGAPRVRRVGVEWRCPGPD